MPFHDKRYQQFDRTSLPVTALAEDYDDGYRTPTHHHPNAQLMHAVRGVMVVNTERGQWIVPPARGLWIPAGIEHAIRMVGEVHMRTAFIRHDAAPDIPQQCVVLKISALLRELILAAIEIPLPYSNDSRDGRVMQLILDEIKHLPSLPLHLPLPSDARLLQICSALTDTPDDATTLDVWAQRLQINPKTVQRLFMRETGMTFGQWRMQARLLVALERLGSGAKVIDVAFDMGYESPNAFATMFKKQFGVTPSQFFKS
ncbi:MAG: AraC family transcriptional regulator [Verrucomicrobiaceae bacterium]|nr:AraC family transcriptional regulator [Verrucomicrobiaceae bacterium]